MSITTILQNVYGLMCNMFRLNYKPSSGTISMYVENPYMILIYVEHVRLTDKSKQAAHKTVNIVQYSCDWLSSYPHVYVHITTESLTLRLTKYKARSPIIKIDIKTPGKSKNFICSTNRPDRRRTPLYLLFNGFLKVLPSGVKRWEHEARHSHPFSV